MKHFLILTCFSLTFAVQLYGAEKTIRGKAIFGNDVKNIVPGALVSYQPCYQYNDTALDKTDLKTDENGEFEFQVRNASICVEVLTPDRNFGKVRIVQPTEDELVVSLELTASIRGRILNSRNEEPLVGQSVTCSISQGEVGPAYRRPFERKTKTNEKGEYEFCNIPTGFNYDVYFPTYTYGAEQSYSTVWIDRWFELQPGEGRECKTLNYDLRPSGAVEYYFQVNAFYFRPLTHEQLKPLNPGQNPIEQRFQALLRLAQRDGKGVFTILLRDKSEEEVLETLKEIYVMLFKSDDVFEQTERFYMMCVLMQPEGKVLLVRPEMPEEFAKSHKIAEKPLPALFSFAFFDADGKLRDVEPFDHTASPAKRKQDLFEMLKKY